jgi:hypothetical protein
MTEQETKIYNIEETLKNHSVSASIGLSSNEVKVRVQKFGRNEILQNPSLKFFIPAFSTRIIGALVAIFGIFMASMSWKEVGYIWLYATAWFIINDFLKVWTFKLIKK